MAYRSTRKRRRDQNNQKAVLLLVAALMIIGGATYFYKQLLDQQVHIDPDSMCPVSGPTAVTAVLIDSTDPFSTIQQEYLRKYFDELLESLKEFEMIQVYSAASYGNQDFQPLVSLCNPGDGANASEWTSNPERMRKRWEKLFDDPLRHMLDESIDKEGANKSPLMSMLQALSIKSFPLRNTDTLLNLIVISDMLEHTDVYSQYSDTAEFSQVSSRPFFAHVTPNLSHVDVTVIYVSRPGLERLQTNSHANFWGQYFAHFGAKVRLVKRI